MMRSTLLLSRLDGKKISSVLAKTLFSTSSASQAPLPRLPPSSQQLQMRPAPLRFVEHRPSLRSQRAFFSSSTPAKTQEGNQEETPKKTEEQGEDESANYIRSKCSLDDPFGKFTYFEIYLIVALIATICTVIPIWKALNDIQEQNANASNR